MIYLKPVATLSDFITRFRILGLFCFSLLLTGCNLTVNTTGSGTVEFSQSTYKACASKLEKCTAWPAGEEVVLTAIPEDGYYFHGWEGDCSGLGACVLKMSAHRTVRAVFLAQEGLLPAPEFKPGTDHFFSAPWPNDAYSVTSDGAVDLKEFPFKAGTAWEGALKRLARNTHGFSTNGAVMFQLAVGYTLPDYYVFNYQARIINSDQSSAQYGEQIPADIAFYEAPDAADATERARLLIVTPRPGYPLAPKTTYTVGLYNVYSVSAPSPLMQALNGSYSTQTNITEALFDTLKAQKQLLLSLYSREPVAFTSFTTQDVKHIDRAIGNTLNEFTDDDIRASVASVDKQSECESEYHTENYLIKTSMPVFQKGTKPYLLSGGSIVVEDARAIIQDYEVVDLLLQIPCEEPPPEGFPLKVHASETLLDWSEQSVNSPAGNQRVIQLILSAPESASRASTLIERLDNLLLKFGMDEWARLVLLGIITDFNVFNLESAKYSHMQYGAELFYSQRVATQITQLITDNDRLIVAPNQRVLSGDSAGGIALLHARAMGAQADMLISSNAPRPSYLHISSIVDFLLQIEDIPDGFIDFLSDLTGLTIENNRNQPLAHIVQTVLEPMDTINYLDELEIPELLYVLADQDDRLHGGEAGYSVAAALDRQLDLAPFLGGPSYAYASELGMSLDLDDAMGYEDLGSGNQTRILSIYNSVFEKSRNLVETAPYHGSRCYAFDVFSKGRPFSGEVNFSYYDLRSEAPLCQ